MSVIGVRRVESEERKAGVSVGTEVGVGIDVGMNVGMGVSVGIDVGMNVDVDVAVSIAICPDVAPHPDNPGKSNNESNKMPALKNIFVILDSFSSSLPPNSLGFTCATQ